jgi:cell division protein FtsA
MLRDKIGSMVKDRQLSGNVVLTGGGALLPGIIEVACEVFDTRAVRIGAPGNFGGLQDEYRRPEYSTAVGLVVSNLDKKLGNESQKGEKSSGKKKNVFSTIGGWFKEFF